MAANKGQSFIVLAILLGVAAAAVGYFSLKQLAASAANASGAGLRPVVVMAADLEFGHRLEAPNLKVVNFPKDAVPLGAYSTLDSVVGQTTKVSMGVGEPVTALKLSTRGGGLSLTIPPGKRAASIEVDQVSGVSGFVLPADRVDVLVTVRPTNANQDPVTETVLQNLKVLAAGQKTNQGDNKPLSVQAVTLEVEPSEAQILTHAQREGQVMLVLRYPGDDTTYKNIKGVSTQQMLGRAEPAAPRARVVVRNVSTPAPQAPKVFKPREAFLIRGGSVGKVTVPDSSSK